MKVLFLSILLLFTPYKDKYTCLELDIIVLVDVSGSLEGYELYLNNAVSVLAENLEMSEEGIRMGIITFSSSPNILCHLTGDNKVIKSHIGKLVSQNAHTHLADGLYTSFNELMTNGRKGVKKLIVVISDGVAQDEETVKTIIPQFRLVNISICSVVILATPVNKELMKHISNGCYLESNYENLPKEIEKLDICI